jgi:enoyl-CoA hydratase
MGNSVKLEHIGNVALVTMCRPDARNAVNFELATDLLATMNEAQSSRVIVLTGMDPAFCAGLVLKNLGIDNLADIPHFVDSAGNSKIPVIAAVNGAAVTGGLELALACDFIVASENAKFADTHLRVGVYPGPVVVDLPRKVGAAKAAEMSLTGDFVDATTALRIGLANHVVPHSELIPTAMRIAESIAEQDPVMVAAIREEWKYLNTLPLHEAREEHLRNAAKIGSSSRTSEDLAARRKAVIDRAHKQQ